MCYNSEHMFDIREVKNMVDTEKLEEITAKCHIIKEFATLPDSIYGHYYCDGNYYVILINEKLKRNERLYRCVLAEELGHYRTTIGDITPRRYMCYSERLDIDKKELAAIRWAVDFLVPTSALLYAVSRGKVESIEDMAEYFCVTEEFILQKLEFMSKKNGLWHLDGKRYLYLLNFPSIHIYEKM